MHSITPKIPLKKQESAKIRYFYEAQIALDNARLYHFYSLKRAEIDRNGVKLGAYNFILTCKILSIDNVASVANSNERGYINVFSPMREICGKLESPTFLYLRDITQQNYPKNAETIINGCTLRWSI